MLKARGNGVVTTIDNVCILVKIDYIFYVFFSFKISADTTIAELKKQVAVHSKLHEE